MIKLLDNLTDRQREALAIVRKCIRVLLFGGARSGKTFLLVLTIIYRSLKFPGSRHLIARSQLKDARTSVWMETLLPLLEKLPAGMCQINSTDLFVRFPNGAEIWICGLDDKKKVEHALGHEYCTIYVVEISEVGDYSIIEKLMTRLAQKIEGCVNKAFFDCNPPEPTHWAHRYFLEFVNPGTLKPYKHKELVGSLQMNPIHNKENLPPGYIEMTLGSLSEDQRRRFEFGEWISSDSINQLIGSDWIRDCQAMRAKQEDDEFYLGVDVGRHGPDPTVFYLMQGVNTYDIEAYDKTDAPEVENRTKAIIEDKNIPHQNVAMDGVGIGGPIIDHLLNDGYDIYEFIGGGSVIETADESFFRFLNLRAQAHWQLREDHRHHILGNVTNPITISDLKALRYDIVGDKKIRIWDKAKIKKELGRSPDYADAYGMANFVRNFSKYFGNEIYTSADFEREERERLEKERQEQGEQAEPAIKVQYTHDGK